MQSTRALLLALALPLLALLPLSACGGGEGSAVGGAGAAGSAAGAPVMPLYLRGNCHSCHGPQLGGTQLGPALKDLREHWNLESLVEYLQNPQAVTDRTPRLRERRSLYPMRMPPAAQAGLSREEIRTLAAWLLAEDRQP
jgi:mono/diheme cytochrome c family protein